MGKVFWAGASAEMGGRNLGEVEQALHELARKELVRPARTSSMAGEAEYGFWHLLVRDVAYNQIPRRPCRPASAAAGWLERQAGERVEDLADVLAYHYTQRSSSPTQPATPSKRPQLPAGQPLPGAGRRARPGTRHRPGRDQARPGARACPAERPRSEPGCWCGGRRRAAAGAAPGGRRATRAGAHRYRERASRWRRPRPDPALAGRACGWATREAVGCSPRRRPARAGERRAPSSSAPTPTRPDASAHGPICGGDRRRRAGARARRRARATGAGMRARLPRPRPRALGDPEGSRDGAGARAHAPAGRRPRGRRHLRQPRRGSVGPPRGRRRDRRASEGDRLQPAARHHRGRAAASTASAERSLAALGHTEEALAEAPAARRPDRRHRRHALR